VVGVAVASLARDKDAVVSALLDAFPHVEVHDWEVGGRG
jgi:hypothetical protein